MSENPAKGSVSKKKTFLVVTTGVLLGVVAVYVTAVFFSARQTPANTKVAGIDVGGMSIAEASTKQLRRRLTIYQQSPVSDLLVPQPCLLKVQTGKYSTLSTQKN